MLRDRLNRAICRLVPVQKTRLKLRKGALSISFDDFPRSAWTIGGRLLSEHGLKGTYYVSGSLMNSNHCGMPHFTMDDLHEVFNDGHEVGNHTFDHLSALRVSPNEFLLSIDKNQKFLSGILGEHNSETFAYPFGDMNLSTKARMRNKFIASRGIFNGLNGEVAELSNLRSIGLEEKNRGKFDFSRLIPFAAEKKAWLIIFTHDVAESPSPYGCRADDLRGVLRLAMKEGLWVAPVATVLEEALAPRNVM